LAKLLPSSMASFTLESTLCMVFDRVWGISVLTALTRGNPADKRVDICLIIMDSSDELTFENSVNPLKKEGVFFSLAVESDSILLSKVGKIFCCRNLDFAAEVLSASRMPDTFFPLLFNALYSNTAIMKNLWTVIPDPTRLSK